MRGFVALLRREWLESRYVYLGTTIAVALVLSLGAGIGLAVAQKANGEMVSVTERTDADGNRHREEIRTDNLSRFGDFTGLTNRELELRLGGARRAIASSFHIVYFLVVAFVLLGCLYDERRDRSVLFWKSMPTTDTATVLAKLVVPVWLVPILLSAVIFFTWLVLLSMVSIIVDQEALGSVGRLWTNSGVLAGLAQELVGFAVQGLWALPIYGWLVLVSAFATRLPLLWAALLPLSITVVERLAFGTSVIGSFFRRHLEFAALPRSIEPGSRLTPAVDSIGDQLALFATVDLWLGVLIGGCAVAATIYWHRRTNEL